MSKNEFLQELRRRLSGLEQSEVSQRLAFFDEIIEDYKADGVPEEEAVKRLGTVDGIVAQVASEIPLARLVAKKVKGKSTSHVGKILAVIFTFPLWFPLLIVLFTLIFAWYIVLWALVISLFAVDAALFCVGVFGILSTIPLMAEQNTALAGLMLGAAFLCLGLFMLLFFVSVMAGKGTAKVGKSILLWIKSLFFGKGAKAYA